jgi:hypothetical protein
MSLGFICGPSPPLHQNGSNAAKVVEDPKIIWLNILHYRRFLRQDWQAPGLRRRAADLLAEAEHRLFNPDGSSSHPRTGPAEDGL